MSAPSPDPYDRPGGGDLPGGPVEAGAPAGPRKAPLARRALEWLAIVLIAAAAAFGIKTYLIQAFYIPSGSMLPTLRIGDRILVDKLSYDLHAIHRNDIVVFARPAQDTGDPGVQDLVKRVVGLPGDRISSSPDGRVLIDGKALPEPFITPYHRDGPGAGVPISPEVIPPGRYFVMGDNRNDSKDSRFFGPIRGSLVVGRVVLRIWPLPSIRLF